MAEVSPLLFSWNDVEARSDLDRFYLVRDNLPDENIVMVLEERRGNGRDDFPIRAMWNALIAGIVFQHASIESLIRELSRNPALLEACGFDILPRYKKPVVELRRNEETGRMEIIRSESGDAYFLVPGSWNFSRFLKSVIELEENSNMVSGMVRGLRESLMEELPDFGCHLGYDGKAINSYSTGQESRGVGVKWGSSIKGLVKIKNTSPLKKLYFFSWLQTAYQHGFV